MKLKLPAGEFRAYLFDCDGTIVDSMPLHYIAWKQALGEWGCTFDEELFYAWGGKPAARSSPTLNQMQGLKCRSKPSPSARRTLLRAAPAAQAGAGGGGAHQAQHGRIPFAVVSGSSRESIVKSLTAVDLLDRFDTHRRLRRLDALQARSRCISDRRRAARRRAQRLPRL